jgi:magnesium chelatase family protein
LHIEVPAVAAGDLALPPAAEGSAEVAARVARARAVQTARYQDANCGKPVRTNAEVDGERLMAVAAPDPSGAALLSEAVDKMKLSARAYHRVLRVARTLADLEGVEAVTRLHIAEALSYRRMAVRG